MLLTSCSATWNIFLSENKLCSVWSIQPNLRHPAAYNCTDELQQIFTLHTVAWHSNECKPLHGILDTKRFRQALFRDHCAETLRLTAPSVESSHSPEYAQLSSKSSIRAKVLNKVGCKWMEITAPAQSKQ